MALARYKDLCVDAVDPDRLARFWAAVLDLRPDLRGASPSPLSGPTKQHTLWVNPVPERKTVKHRVHLDVNAPSVEEILAFGATVVDDQSFAWTVLADPEGGEFCVFVREGEIAARFYELGVDAAEPHEIAAWWGDVLGAHVGDEPDDGVSYVEQIPGAPFESLVFARVPEPKTVKNRVHWDVATPDVQALVTAGASVVRPPDEEIDWHVLADPEGNEFCAFIRPEG
ncbi:MAG TPA: VOC family protein [Nocardioidaceae bacterium]|nr:VOC family protein [Nocardioidaceae bacterium]